MAVEVQDLSGRAGRLYQDAIVIDGMGGSARAAERLLAAGVTAVNVTVGQTERFRETIKNIADYLLLLDALEEQTLLVKTAEDIHRAKSDGRLGIILGFQGAAPIEDTFEYISIFHQLGLRVFQLTYQESNSLGSSCMEREDRGLTEFGREVVRELNRLGIVMDLSHVGMRTSLEAIEVSKDPAIFSHANARAVCDNIRNITDEQVRAVAAKGGVVGVTPYSIFAETKPGVRPTLDDYITHIDYLVQLVGIDHIGIGTDLFEGNTRANFQKFLIRYPEMFRPYSKFETRHCVGLETIAGLPGVAVGLLRRGYAEEDTRRILGGNFLRVFKQVWHPLSR